MVELRRERCFHNRCDLFQLFCNLNNNNLLLTTYLYSLATLGNLEESWNATKLV